MIYLDNSATTQPLPEVVASAEKFLSTYGSIHRGYGHNSNKSTDAYESARATVENYIKAEDGKDVVIFTGNTTDGINKFCLIFPWNIGDQVLISDIEHSANFLPWQKFASIVRVKTDSNYRIDPSDVDRELSNNPNVRVVSLSGASNITGEVSNIKEIYKVCKKHNVYFFVDASQTMGHYPLTLDECDFMAFSGHKMYAPYGGGVLAGRKVILDNPGMGLTGGGNIIFATDDGVAYKEAPYLHEAGTPNGLGAITIATALTTLHEKYGYDYIQKHDREVSRWWKKYIVPIQEIEVFFCEGSNLVFTVKDGDDDSFAKKLGDAGISLRYGAFCVYSMICRMLGIEEHNVLSYVNKHKSLPKDFGVIRCSAGLMTTEEDIKQLSEIIKKEVKHV